MRTPYRSPAFWARSKQGVLIVGGEIDLATYDAFTAVVDAVIRDAGQAGSTSAHLDLAGLAFIDVGGVRVLVAAAAKLPMGRELVVHHPSAMLVRILTIGWGRAPGLRLEQCPATADSTADRAILLDT